jgi:hypothetical protein
LPRRLPAFLLLLLRNSQSPRQSLISFFIVNASPQDFALRVYQRSQCMPLTL